MIQQFKGQYIGGGWVPANQGFESLNPSDGSVWGDIPDGGRREVRMAIDAAQRALPEWAGLPFQHRSRMMTKFADILERRRGELAEHIMKESGSWFGKAQFEIGLAADAWHAAAAACYGPSGEVLPSEHNKVSLAVRRPLGVFAVISPWNVPLVLTSRPMAFALAAGNAVVLKPSEETPYCGGILFAEIAEEAGLPPGVLNVVTCSRNNVGEVGDELIEHPLVKGIMFTGSTAVGRQIAAKAGAHLKKCCVELGGKDALIVCDDADLERASGAASFGSFMHQGQICMSVEKLLVQENIYDAFMDRFRARAANLKVGPTSDNDNVIGPLINDKQAAKVKDQIDDAIAKGATAEVGGGVEGRFVQPTVLTGITPDMKVYREETFGPIVPVIPYRTDDEAIAIANDTEYGLSSGVITQNENRGLAIAERLETGMCHINCSPINDEPHAPFGGMKSSGVGRYGGRWAMENFTETRWITMDRGERPFPPMF